MQYRSSSTILWTPRTSLDLLAGSAPAGAPRHPYTRSPAHPIRGGVALEMIPPEATILLDYSIYLINTLAVYSVLRYTIQIIYDFIWRCGPNVRSESINSPRNPR